MQRLTLTITLDFDSEVDPYEFVDELSEKLYQTDSIGVFEIVVEE